MLIPSRNPNEDEIAGYEELLKKLEEVNISREELILKLQEEHGLLEGESIDEEGCILKVDGSKKLSCLKVPKDLVVSIVSVSLELKRVNLDIRKFIYNLRLSCDASFSAKLNHKMQWVDAENNPLIVE